MKAIIPVAGEGTRLRPHTHTIPKPLIRVAGKPILGHILDDAVKVGISDIVLIVGYRGQEIVDYVRAAYDVRVNFVEQEARLGLGHAIHLARKYVGGSEPAFIILGDSIFKGDLKAMMASDTNCIGVKQVEDPQRFGIAKLEGPRIVHLVEKPERPESNLAVVGLYFIKDTGALFGALDSIISSETRTKGEFQLTDALNLMIKEGVDLRAFEVDSWFDCGKAETLLATNRALLEMSAPKVAIDGSIIIDPVYIAADATVEASVIGPYVSIAEQSTVRKSIVRNTIIGESATVEDALLDSSLVGDNAVVRGMFKRLNVGDSSEIDFT